MLLCSGHGVTRCVRKGGEMDEVYKPAENGMCGCEDTIVDDKVVGSQAVHQVLYESVPGTVMFHYV